MGLSGSARKRDPILRELFQRQDRLHASRTKLRAREIGRVHVSVLLHEAVESLMALGPHGLYVDCTFGRGGHSQLILSRLSPDGRLKAFDIDPTAVEVGERMREADSRFEIVHAPFSELAHRIDEPHRVAGVLLDLGVSSPQLDEPHRGFSIKGRKDGPLDLRMNQHAGVPASAWLQTVTEAQLTWVLQQTCHVLEPPLHERVAEELLEWQRCNGPFTSTQQFSKALAGMQSELLSEHPTIKLASVVKTSIRIFLNQEMEQLQRALEGAFERLEFSGRCCVICFNRWEVATLRDFLRKSEEPCVDVARRLPPERLAELYPLLASEKEYAVRRVSRPIRPTQEELERNERAKSSLHVLEKVPRRRAELERREGN
jgi:16S rRNA (cytosine1402-N4)-methyltransferase